MVEVASDLLVVHSDSDVRQVLRHVLQETGHAVRTAATVASALDAVERQRPGLILLDVRPGRLDGDAFARTLRERGRDIPILVVTADRARAAAQRIGAQGWLDLPCDLEDLLWAVTALAKPVRQAPTTALAPQGGLAGRVPPAPQGEPPLALPASAQPLPIGIAHVPDIYNFEQQFAHHLQRIAYQVQLLQQISPGVEAEQMTRAMIQLLQQATEAAHRVQNAIERVPAGEVPYSGTSIAPTEHDPSTATLESPPPSVTERSA